MPPAGMPRPDEATYKNLAAWLERQIDSAASLTSGRPILHRLNRAEYANAIRDLLALDIDAASLLPPDDSAYGFDNISDALGVSPALQEHYLDAALKIGALAVGDPNIAPGSETWRIRQDLSQDQHINGMPLGTVGGTLVRYNFPLDGEYAFQAKLYRTNLNIMRGLESPHQVEFAVDGRRIHLAIDRRQGRSGVAVRKAHRYGRCGGCAAARSRSHQGRSARRHGGFPGRTRRRGAGAACSPTCAVRWTISIGRAGRISRRSPLRGRFIRRPPGDTPSRRRIFMCHPGSPHEPKRLVRARSSPRWRAALTASRERVRTGYADEVLSVRKDATAASRAALKWRWNGSWPARSLCSASSAIRGRRPVARYRIARHRIGFAPVVLSLEQHSRRRAAASGGRGQAAGSPRCWTARCAACWPIPRRKRWWATSLDSGCSFATCATCSRIRTCSRISTTICASPCAVRRSCSSKA